MQKASITAAVGLWELVFQIGLQQAAEHADPINGIQPNMMLTRYCLQAK